MLTSKRLLSVDFDYFFEEKSFDPDFWMLYDWGHRDGGNLFLERLWYSRAAAFKANNLELPTTTGLEKNFWDRFSFPKSTVLYYADSHVNIYNERVRKNITEVYSYDAHHDGGYQNPQDDVERRKAQTAWMENGKVTCEDWAFAYQYIHQIPVKVYYPAWKEWAMKAEPEPLDKYLERFVDAGENLVGKNFHRIFVCRSGGWFPSWLDDKFDAFVKACPVKTKIPIGSIENRNFDEYQLNLEIEQMLECRKSFLKGVENEI